MDTVSINFKRSSSLNEGGQEGYYSLKCKICGETFIFRRSSDFITIIFVEFGFAVVLVTGRKEMLLFLLHPENMAFGHSMY
jgi:hypothetical protein